MENSDNKNKIIDVALFAFSKNGYAQTSVQAICEMANVTKPTLYYYFSNKEGLLDEVLRVNYEKMNNLIRQNANYIPCPNIYEKDVFFTLSNVANCYLDFSKNNEAFYKMVLFATFSPNDSDFCKIAQKYNKIQYEIIEDMFCNMAKIHKNMEDKQTRLAWSFIGLINASIAQKTADCAQSFVKQFMHGIYS